MGASSDPPNPEREGTLNASRTLLWPLLGFLAAAFVGGGCGSGRTVVAGGGGSNSSGGPSTQLTLSRDLQPILEAANCTVAGCHGGTAPQLGQDLSSADRSFASLVNVPSVEVDGLLRVKPGDSANSYLFEKISQDSPREGTRMPQGFPPLSDTQIETIRRWIDGGALP